MGYMKSTNIFELTTLFSLFIRDLLKYMENNNFTTIAVTEDGALFSDEYFMKCISFPRDINKLFKVVDHGKGTVLGITENRVLYYLMNLRLMKEDNMSIVANTSRDAQCFTISTDGVESEINAHRLRRFTLRDVASHKNILSFYMDVLADEEIDNTLSNFKSVWFANNQS